MTNTSNFGFRHQNTQETRSLTRQYRSEGLCNLQETEKPNSSHDEQSRRKFLRNFDWKESMLQQHEIKGIKSLLVEFQDIFARHRFDIKINEEFTVTLTPNDNSPANSRSLPTPIILKEEILVELASLQ